MNDESANKSKSIILKYKFKIIIAIIGACSVIIVAIIKAKPFYSELKQTKEQLKQIRDSLNTEQTKVVQLKMELDNLNKSLNDCKKSREDSVTKEKIFSNLVNEGKRIKGNCTQPNIAKEFDTWKSKCINQLKRYIPDIQNKIEDSIKNAPPNNYCVKTESIIYLLNLLKKE